MEYPGNSLLDHLTQTLKTIAETTYFDLPGHRLVVGVSGGPDSLALLHALHRIIPADELVVAHLDHQLRPESATEAVYVRDLAEKWGLPFHGTAIDVAALAQAGQQSVEEAGRQTRYRFLAETAQATGAVAVVTGHHADDQTETVLMHILRGAGLAGLRGMLPAAPLPEEPDIWLLRPLLGISREAIEQYCRANQLQPLTDATNTDVAYFRNRLRHELLPILRSYNPRIDEHLQHLSDVVAADYDLLEGLTEAKLETLAQDWGPGWLMLGRSEWEQLPLALRRSTLRAAVRQIASAQRDIGFATLEAARLVAEAHRSGQQSHLPGGVVLHVTADTLLLTADADVLASLAPQVPEGPPIALAVPGRLRLVNGLRLTAELVPSMWLEQIERNRDPWMAYVALRPTDSLIVRGRLRGERVQPLGLDGRSAALKEIMIDRKIPAPLRANWPVVATADHAVWLAGHVIDHRCRVTADAGRLVRLRIAGV